MPTETEVSREAGPYLEKFERIAKAKQPAWVLPLRQAGMSWFAEQGFPTLHDEDWRFTNVAPIAKLPFRPVFEPETEAVAEKKLKEAPFAALPGNRLVFVNGQFVLQWSSLKPLPGGARAENLAAALRREPAVL